MTTSLVAEFSHPLRATIIGRRSYPARSERVTGNVLRNWRNLMTAFTGSLDLSGNRAGRICDSGLPAGRNRRGRHQCRPALGWPIPRTACTDADN